MITRINLFCCLFFVISSTLCKSALIAGTCTFTASAFTPPSTTSRVVLQSAVATDKGMRDDKASTSGGRVRLLEEGAPVSSPLASSGTLPQSFHQKHLGQHRSLALFYSKGSFQVSSHQVFFQNLDAIYTEASSTIRCPFIKRRVADTIDNIAMIMRFLIVRHKSLWPATPKSNFNKSNWDGCSVLGHNNCDDQDYMQVPGCKAAGKYIQIDELTGKSVKKKHLPLETIKDIIIQDWSTHNDKGYYVTGKLNSTIYRDDCLFDGPDPDMPVKGLRKYLGAASHLFDASKSSATLMDVKTVQVEAKKTAVIEVKWRMEGVLMLPWRPRVRPWSGWTRYHLDGDNLIEYHQEGWDISVVEAFVGTMFPSLADKLWKKTRYE